MDGFENVCQGDRRSVQRSETEPSGKMWRTAHGLCSGGWSSRSSWQYRQGIEGNSWIKEWTKSFLGYVLKKDVSDFCNKKHFKHGWTASFEILRQKAISVWQSAKLRQDAFSNISLNICYVIKSNICIHGEIVLDPVMGDSSGLYVSDEVIPVYKSLLPYADLLMPNSFEAGSVSPCYIGASSTC